MVPGFLLGLLLALPLAAQTDDRTVSLRLEDGLEVRRADFRIDANNFQNAVFISTSGARVETLIFSLMPVETPDPRRVDLSYQLEWSRTENGATVFVRQTNDWARIPENRDVLLLNVDDRWNLWGSVKTNEDKSCLEPPKGGGLKATIYASKDGVERKFIRRTSDGVTSNLAIQIGNSRFFHFSLTPRLLKKKRRAEIDYLASWDAHGFEKKTTTQEIPLGKETTLENGVRITLETVTVEDALNALGLSQRDPESGWYLHKGRTLSFSYPPEWRLRESCDSSKKPNGWNLDNRTKTENPLHAVHVWGFLQGQKTEELKEEGTAELLEVKGGKCLVWRDEVGDPLCREKCAPSLIARAQCRSKEEGGPNPTFNFDLGKESGLETKRYSNFLRFIKSFAF